MSDTNLKASNPWLRRGLILLGYLILAVLFTRPLAWNLNQGYIADVAANADGSYHFNPYQLQQCLRNGTSCRHTELQCFPIGNSLALNTNMPLPSLASQLWPNTTTGLNIVLLLHCMLVAAGGYLFARLFIKSPALAFVAGALFSFWIGRSAHLYHGHANLMFAASLPFALYAFHRMLPMYFEKTQFLSFRPKWALIFAVLAAVTTLHDLILGGFLVIYCFLVVVLTTYRLWIFPRNWFWQVIIVVGLVVIVDQATQWMTWWKFQDNGAFFFSGSFKNLVFPHPVSKIYSSFFFAENQKLTTQPGFDIGRVMFPGYMLWALGLLVAGYRVIRKNGIAQPWLFVLLAMGLLYTMPLLRWTNGRLFYGPFSLTHFVALWNENRCPTRFMDVLLLIGPVWLMANIEGLHFWKDLRWGMKLMTGMALTTVLLAEHYPKEFQFVDLKRGPAVYAALANSQEESAMFVPFGLVDGKHAFGAMWLEPFAFQPVHGRKMNNGFLSRIDAATWDYFENDTFIVRLVRNQSHEKDTPFPNPEYDPCIYTPTDYSETKKAIEKFRLSQIVIRRDLLKDPVTDFLFASLGPFIVSDTTFAEGHRLIGLRPN